MIWFEGGKYGLRKKYLDTWDTLESLDFKGVGGSARARAPAASANSAELPAPPGFRLSGTGRPKPALA